MARGSQPSTGKDATASTAIRRSRAKVLPFVPEDSLTILQDGLRAQDVAEITALGRDPRAALLDAVSSCGALVFTIHVDGRAAGVFGVMPTAEPGLGAVWMVGTDRLLLIPRDLVLESRRWIDFLNLIYPVLSNFVDERNDVSIRWLERMGFDFPYTDDFITPEGIVFRRFIRCAIPSR